MKHASLSLSRALAVLLAVGVLALVPTSAHADPPAPVDGAQTSGDTQFPNIGNGGYDVLDYDINLVWTPPTIPGVTPDQSIAAVTTITATTTGNALKSFSLDFEGLTLDSVKVNGVTATTSRVQDQSANRFKLVVTPATPVSGQFTTVVTYHGTPSAHTDADLSKEGWNATDDGAIFVNQPVGSMTGFPNNNTPGDKATYTYTLSVPTTLTTGPGTAALPSAAVANGSLVSKTAIAGSRTQWVWDVTKPMASELSLIGIGQFDMVTADLPLAAGNVVKEWTFIDPNASGAAGAATARTKLKDYLDFFQARYGPYPNDSIGIVVDDVNSLTSGINYALETQDRPFFPGSAGTGTVIHEVMHQWFGDSVSPRNWNHIWLNEGPATYAEVQYPNEAGTETSFYNQWSSTSSTSSTWTTPTVNEADNDSSDLFDAQVYDRGAMALEALRTAVTAPVFAQVMKEWNLRYTGTSRNTTEFRQLAEELSGRDLGAFFQDWIYDADKPAWPGRFTLALESTPTTGGVLAGGGFSYAVKAASTGKVALTGAVVRLDLSDVLDDATIDAPPAGTTMDGSTLTWNVPSTAPGATSTLTVPLHVKAGVAGGTLTANAQIPATTLGGTCTTCTSTLGAGQPSLSPAPDPTITGVAKVGQTLTADTTGWAAGASFAYLWKRGGAAIPGATEATYQPTASDLGATLTVQVTGSKSGFADVTKTSAPTAAVAAGDQSSTPKPTITGSPQVGQTLTAVPGSWDPGVALEYQWAANGTDIAGATGTTYAPVAGDVGKQVTVSVTGAKPGYATVTRVSDPTAPVAGGTQALTPTPTVSGTPKVGQALTVDPGTWDAGVTKTYQWAAGGADISGATGAMYAPVPGDVGKTITVAVTGTKPGYATVTRTSAPTAAVATGDQLSTPTPSVSGVPRVGEVLGADPGTWDPGVTLSYQWSANGSAVPGATVPWYVLGAEDRGKRMTVTVTGTRSGFTTVSRTSGRTARVAKGRLGDVPRPTISGTAKVGKKLTAVPGSWPAGVTLSYQWYVGSKAIDRATRPTLKVRKAYRGKRVLVKVTGTRPGYQTRSAVSRRSGVVV